MRIHNKTIRVTTYAEDGNRVRSFKSIAEFIKFAIGRWKFSQHNLRQLREGKMVYYGGYAVGLSKFYNHDYISLYHYCSHFRNKINHPKHVNLDKLSEIESQEILIIDSNFKLVGRHKGGLTELSRLHKIPTGTIKASLHRSANRFSSNRDNAQYYVYLQDLPIFIKNARKHLRLKNK